MPQLVCNSCVLMAAANICPIHKAPWLVMTAQHTRLARRKLCSLLNLYAQSPFAYLGLA